MLSFIRFLNLSFIFLEAKKKPEINKLENKKTEYDIEVNKRHNWNLVKLEDANLEI